jgi:hypothetical protein
MPARVTGAGREAEIRQNWFSFRTKFSTACELDHIRRCDSEPWWTSPDGVSRFQYPGLARSLTVYCVNGLVFSQGFSTPGRCSSPSCRPRRSRADPALNGIRCPLRTCGAASGRTGRGRAAAACCPPAAPLPPALPPPPLSCAPSGIASTARLISASAQRHRMCCRRSGHRKFSVSDVNDGRTRPFRNKFRWP